MADQHGSIVATKETRDDLGVGLLGFIGSHIIIERAVPLLSGADCNPDGSPTSAFRAEFTAVADGARVSELSCQIVKDRQGHGASYLPITPEFGMIAVPDKIKTAREYFSSTSGIPDGQVTLPESGKDWAAFLLFHEAQHQRDDVTNPDNINNPLAEHSADRGARAFYKQALAEGIVSDPGVPDAARAARILGDMNGGSAVDGYTAAALADVSGVVLRNAADFKNVSASVESAKAKVFQEIGEPLTSEAEKRNPADLQKIIEKNALEAINKNPQLLYETVRKDYLQGAFDGDKVQKAYMGQFLHAAETYAPDCYKTENRHTVDAGLNTGTSRTQIQPGPSQEQKAQMAPA